MIAAVRNPAVPPAIYPAHPAERGYLPSYRVGASNHCPGCGRSHWYVGRLYAECAFCATAVAIGPDVKERGGDAL